MTALEEEDTIMTGVRDLQNGLYRLHEYRANGDTLEVDRSYLKGYESCAYGGADTKDEFRERVQELDEQFEDSNFGDMYAFDRIANEVLVE